ncbi:hypothetical protein OPV22_006039 [Ensete ventricosum]|uniref:Secreted protein n=1 Tax=Ensete ventricosum TaxID=4639 RepID=A0AAV8RS91_ENSVE|nr:hypothetical protein OPV22_006039 [Ensete ventricosum]
MQAFTWSTLAAFSRQRKPPQELAASPLHEVPLVSLLLLLAPLAADLEDPFAFLHPLFLHPGEVRLEEVLAKADSVREHGSHRKGVTNVEGESMWWLVHES